jgi:hypothetical protein
MPLVMAGSSNDCCVLHQYGILTLEAMAYHHKTFRECRDGSLRVIDDSQKSQVKALNVYRYGGPVAGGYKCAAWQEVCSMAGSTVYQVQLFCAMCDPVYDVLQHTLVCLCWRHLQQIR